MICKNEKQTVWCFKVGHFYLLVVNVEKRQKLSDISNSFWILVLHFCLVQVDNMNVFFDISQSKSIWFKAKNFISFRQKNIRFKLSDHSCGSFQYQTLINQFGRRSFNGRNFYQVILSPSSILIEPPKERWS